MEQETNDEGGEGGVCNVSMLTNALLKNTEGEMKDEVVEEEEVGETKQMATADLQQQQEEEDVCPVCIEALQKDTKESK